MKQLKLPNITTKYFIYASPAPPVTLSRMELFEKPEEFECTDEAGIKFVATRHAYFNVMLHKEPIPSFLTSMAVNIATHDWDEAKNIIINKFPVLKSYDSEVFFWLFKIEEIL